MAEAELAVLVDALPERPYHAPAWVDGVLRERWLDYKTPERGEADAPALVRAWSVGSVLGNETLVQTRPVVRDDSLNFMDDFLRATAPCTIAMYTTTREASRPGEASVSRFQRWIGACSQRRLLDAEPARKADLRAHLRDSIPGFLQRSILAHHDDELLFFGFLARLHSAGGVGSTFADAPTIRAALEHLSSDVTAVIGEDHYLNLIVHDGRTCAMLHRGGTLTRWAAPAREAPRHRTGPLPVAGIPRGSALLVLSRQDARDPKSDPLPDGIFSIDPTDPFTMER